MSSGGQELLDCLVPDAAVAAGDDDVTAVLIRQIWNKKYYETNFFDCSYARLFSFYTIIMTSILNYLSTNLPTLLCKSETKVIMKRKYYKLNIYDSVLNGFLTPLKQPQFWNISNILYLSVCLQMCSFTLLFVVLVSTIDCTVCRQKICSLAILITPTCWK